MGKKFNATNDGSASKLIHSFAFNFGFYSKFYASMSMGLTAGDTKPMHRVLNPNKRIKYERTSACISIDSEYPHTMT